MSELKITGTIKTILDTVTGTSKDGNDWKKVEFILSNNEGYQGKEQIFCFQIFGADKVDKFLEYNKEGNEVDVKFNVKTNQHNGRYYTNLDAYGVYGVQGQGTPKPVDPSQPFPSQPQPTDIPEDDLPF